MKTEFARLTEGASDAELSRHTKVVAFKDSIQNSLPEGEFTHCMGKKSSCQSLRVDISEKRGHLT